MAQLTAYIKSKQIMYCPSAAKIGVWMPDFTARGANMAAGNISYDCFSHDRVPSAVTPPWPNFSTWISRGFIGSNVADSLWVTSESWDSQCWLFSDGWCKLTRACYGVILYDSHNGSINICYLDGHVKLQGGEAKAVFK